MIEALDYFEYPRCREAFASGQKDARLEEHRGVYVRRRGRSINQWTVLSFGDATIAWELIKGWRAAGERVQSVDFTSPRAAGVPTIRGPAEWNVTGGYDWEFRDMSSERRRKMRKALATPEISVELAEDRGEVLEVFERWVRWASTRHFMVFKGHYRRWIDMYFEDHGSCRLYIFRRAVDRRGLGVFGFERQGDQSNVVLVKHVDDLNPLVIWLRGIRLIGTSRVMCGSTADYLKMQLGLTPTPSWRFDIGAAR